MKKLVLVTLALGVCFASFAQKNMRSITKISPRGVMQKSIADPNQVAVNAAGPVKNINSNLKSGKSTLNKTLIGTSGNLLTVQFSDIQCLSAWPGLNVVGFTHRAGGTFGGTVNQQRISFSTDAAATFDNFLLTSDQATWANRYPSGVIFNKTGNTTPNHAFVAYGGPYHLGGVWTGYYHASERLDSSLMHVSYVPWTVTYAPTAGLSIINMASCSDETVHGLTAYIQVTAANNLQNDHFEVLNGTLTAADTLQWDTVVIKPTLKHLTSEPVASELFNWGQAWSEDGSVGYVYIFGIDSLVNFNMSCAPIVYKSTNKGLTWTKMPIYDFSAISSIADSIYPLYSNQTTYVPGIFGSEQSGTVDANGNLHIITEIVGEYTNNVDSIGYTYTVEPKKLYDLYTTSTGWDAKCFATIKSASVLSTDAQAIPSSTGAASIGWDHRLHVARTVDGTKLFAVWNDVVDTTTYPNVALPDVIAYSWDVNTGLHTTVKNFTTLTPYDGDNYFMYVGDRVFESGSDFDIPVTTTVPGSDDGQAISHYYLSGIFFSNADYSTDINEINSNISSVSQNYPNPFNGTTTLNVSLVNSSDLSVIVTNIVGQQVSEIQMGTVSAGSHTVTIDASKLTSGIYFYTIKAGESKVTQKMIVQ